MTPVMNPGPPDRGTGAFCAIVAGFLLGAAAVTGCARAEKTVKAPPLPPAKVNWAQAVAGPRQVLVIDPYFAEFRERVDSLLLQGWRAVPGTASICGGGAMLVLEQKPKKGAL